MSAKSAFESTYVELDERALGFLTSELGFQRLERKGKDFGLNIEFWQTIYCKRMGSAPESPSLYVRLAMSPNRLEADLMVSRDRVTWYAIEELERSARGTEEPLEPRGRQAMSEIAVQVDTLARRLRSAGRRFFAGDEALWHELAGVRRQRAPA